MASTAAAGRRHWAASLDGMLRNAPEILAAMLAATLLLLVYGVTAAPGVTWWDAGEFLAAVRTLGIPHPPGTPLFIMIARSWSELLGWLDIARSVNLLSAVCTALAGGLAASIVARATRSTVAGVAAALCAGTMSTVWLSATEAEVYGASLLLAMLMMLAGERAGRTDDPRFVVLTAYLFGLAAPLHVTALVAGPAAVFLAATGEFPHRGVRWRTAGTLGGALLAAAGIGTGRWLLGITGLVLLAIVASMRRLRLPRGWAIPIVMLVAFSAFAFLLVRARMDPGINQGNPATVAAMMSVIARDQYTIAGLFPRQAPVWLQLVNFLEYADWQVALGLGPTVTPTVFRTAMTVVFIVIGALGSVAHHRVHRRSWRALAILGLCGSLGVIAYLNLKAGPSIGYGFIPDDRPHEPRERDYFFVLAFWTWGLWAGIGAVQLAGTWLKRKRTAALALGVAIAVLPAVLNFGAMNRRADPEASLPLALAREMLTASPPRALLLVAGDNDTYPLWYAQQALGLREDVVVLTYPLIGAGWYRDELYRRWGLGSPAPHARWDGMAHEIALIARSAREQGRPIAVAVTTDRTAREQVGRNWRLVGVMYVEGATIPGQEHSMTDGLPVIDRPAVEAAADRLEPLLRRPVRESTDPTSRLMRETLTCPMLARRASVDPVMSPLLDSTCNYR